ncbi:MAG: T9SS type A sorting domain-containing protein [Bacteroidia bacterium]
MDKPVYWNEIDQSCGARIDSVKILRVNTIISAGGDQSLYFIPSLSFMMQGLSDTANGQQAYWTTSGDGSFNDSFDLNAFYTPGSGDLQNGEATLTLTAYPIATCTVFDEMKIHILDSAVKILGAVVDSMAFDTVYVGIYSMSNRANLSWSTNGSGSFVSASSLGVAYVLSASDTNLTNLELIVKNDAPCLKSTDTLHVNPTLKKVLPPNGLEEFEQTYFLYPNPSDGNLHLRTLGFDRIQTLSIFDIHGKEIMLTPHYEEPTYTWDVSLLSEGMYILLVTNEQGMKQALRFVVR